MADSTTEPSSGERLRGAGSRTEGSRTEGSRAEGSRAEGSRAEGARAEGSCRPFVKWAGGKRQLLPELQRYAPPHFERYIEPFVGGGALFFELSSQLRSARTPRALLADVNQRLIRTYLGVRDSVEDVITKLREFKHEEKAYYSVREQPVDDRTDAEVAAWLIYLNKIGFNGLYRVNRQNRFNVPFGRHKNPNICDEQTLRACSRALSGVDLQVAGFEKTAERAQAGDLVYFDPPYVPVSVTSSFTKYTQNGFDTDAQVRLRDVALGLKQRGVHVLLSNSSASSVRELYSKDFLIEEVSATRNVNSKATGRGAVTELVIH